MCEKQAIYVKEYLRKKAIAYLQKYVTSESLFLDYLLRKTKDRTKSDASAEIISYCQSLIDDCKELGLINDQQFTEQKINSLRRKGKSSKYIRQYLLSKRIDMELIQDMIKEEDELDALKLFVKKKKLNPSDQKDLQKIARAGFSYQLIKELNQ